MISIPLIIATGMAFIDVISFSILKKITEHTFVPGLLLLAMGLYAIQPFILLQALTFETLAIMNILWNLMSSIIVSFVCIFILKESISRIKIVGILFGIVSLFLCTYEEKGSIIAQYLPSFI